MMLLESGLKAAESFPAGLKVLVVDDDPTWLKILEKMLKKCSYEVTTCGLAIEALRILRERKDGFDIVISDVNMPDMDGFKLLEHVGLQMDLPVIMMSVDGETSRVMRGVQHGACDYLLKPIRMKELKNIWQHVLRKRMHDVRDIESHDNLDDDDLHLFRYDQSDGGHFLTSSGQTFLKKRKDMDSKKGAKDSADLSAKRRRVVWSVELHQKFVKAVNQIGIDKVGPKKILDLMNVPLLTRENVASHLQKYRLYLSRLDRENDLKSQSPKESVGGFGTQNSAAMQQSELVKFPCQDYKPLEQNIDAKPQLLEMSSVKELKHLSTEICNNVTEQPHLIGLTTNSLTPADDNGLPSFEFKPRNHASNSDPAFGSLTDELGGLYSFQHDNFTTASMGFDNIEYAFPDLSNEALSYCLYGQPRFNYEYFSDSVEYAVVDQSLFIS